MNKNETPQDRGFVLVTGASGGIGGAVRDLLLERGYAVIGLDLAQSAFTHPRYTFIQTDITDGKSVENAVRETGELTRTLAAIVNTAGIVFMGSLIEEHPELMQKILDVNVAGTARVNRYFFPLLERGKGRIVNFSSEYGTFCSIPFHGFYTASKHALESYNDSLRRECAYLGIKVSAMRPGAVDTGMTAGTVPQFERILKTTTHFERSYRKLYPLMAGATKHPTPPAFIARKVYDAITARHPKRYYNVKQDIRVRLLSLLPAPLTDFIFRKFI